MSHTRLQRIAAGRKSRGKGAKFLGDGSESEPEAGSESEPDNVSESESETVSQADIKLSPDEQSELFEDVEELEPEDDGSQELVNRLCPSDDEQEKLDEYLEPYVDSDGDVWERSFGESDVESDEEQQQHDDPTGPYTLDSLIGSGTEGPMPGDVEGPLYIYLPT